MTLKEALKALEIARFNVRYRQKCAERALKDVQDRCKQHVWKDYRSELGGIAITRCSICERTKEND